MYEKTGATQDYTLREAYLFIQQISFFHCQGVKFLCQQRIVYFLIHVVRSFSSTTKRKTGSCHVLSCHHSYLFQLHSRKNFIVSEALGTGPGNREPPVVDREAFAVFAKPPQNR